MSSPYLGIDIGLKRTGLAISESGLIARPLEIVETDYPHLQRIPVRITELVKEYAVQTLVVGMPYTSEGEPTSQSLKAQEILTKITDALTKESLHPTIVSANEIGSTQDGNQLYPGLADDLAAATLILQEYLDTL